MTKGSRPPGESADEPIGKDAPERPPGRSREVRLQKFLSSAGVASRRRAEELITAGRVRVNGRPVTELGVKVDPQRDRIDVDGRRVEPAEPVWVALHKPAGYVTTRRDPQKRPTVYDLLPSRFRGLFHVGRLDAESEGLLLLTNQGDVAHRMLHPRHETDRVYEAHVAGLVEPRTLSRLRRGVHLDDGLARAAGARLVTRDEQRDESVVRITMREGRKREVRRLLETVGHPVRRLIRLRYGPISLGELRPGQWRLLTPAEVRRLGRPRGERSPRRQGGQGGDTREEQGSRGRQRRP